MRAGRHGHSGGLRCLLLFRPGQTGALGTITGCFAAAKRLVASCRPNLPCVRCA